MTIAKTVVALTAAAFVAGAAVPAQAQYLYSGASAVDPYNGWYGWQASSVNSPNRDFLSVGAPSSGDYARSFGFDSGYDVNASCYPAHVHFRLRNGHIVSRVETICP
jgi:hypothetical protein